MKIRPFIKVSKHRRFSYEPRYFDPVKQDIENRSARIMSNNSDFESGKQKIEFKGAFRSKRKTNYRQLFVVYLTLLLTTTIIGWLYFENKIFYITFSLALPPYIFWKVKQYRSRKSD